MANLTSFGGYDLFLVKLTALPLPDLQAGLEYRLIRHGDNPSEDPGDLFILGRPDGYLDYGVDLETQAMVWSIYLGREEQEGAFPVDYGEGFCDWGPKTGSSLIASPAVADSGVVLVGSLEGYLFAVGDEGW